MLYWKRYISATHKLKEHKIAFFKQNKNSFFFEEETYSSSISVCAPWMAAKIMGEEDDEAKKFTLEFATAKMATSVNNLSSKRSTCHHYVRKHLECSRL